MPKLRVFVSSVQNELENERVALLAIVSSDPFLYQHCEPVLYEFEPASPVQAIKGCLKCLETCDIYILLVWREYGRKVGDVSVTHQEYRLAKQKKLPVLVYIKGPAGLQRNPETESFLKEVQDNGLKYKRFGNYLELQREVRASLVQLLKQKYAVEPTSDEDEIAAQTIDATSAFESQPSQRVRWEELDHEIARRLIASAEGKKAAVLQDQQVMGGLMLRGLLWSDPETGQYNATAAGVVLLASDPAAVFPQCRFLADAYRGTEADGNPIDHEEISDPIPVTVEKAIAFIYRNTRHPVH